jgi:hypothetical protein
LELGAKETLLELTIDFEQGYYNHTTTKFVFQNSNYNFFFQQLNPSFFYLELKPKFFLLKNK